MALDDGTSRRRKPDVDRLPETALNRICAYFTMFPLRFPYSLLARRAEAGARVLDPFCGRGTTNYAARLLGLDSLGIDSSRVAAAIAEAKVVGPRPAQILAAYDRLLETVGNIDVPEGEFWQRAYAPGVLRTLCRLREGLTADRTAAAKALRGVILGALHGPIVKGPARYLSNQCPRTYAPKPGYAVKFWHERGLGPPRVDVRHLIEERARYFYGQEATRVCGRIVHADSRTLTARRLGHERFSWIVTSPPYYGMRTYIPDQWLRNWFVGGPAEIEYSTSSQLIHRSPDVFATELRKVWRLAAAVSHDNATLVIRFGGINDRRADPLEILKESLRSSGWRTITAVSAGDASRGRRQARHFKAANASARAEYDVWAKRAGITVPAVA